MTMENQELISLDINSPGGTKMAGSQKNGHTSSSALSTSPSNGHHNEISSRSRSNSSASSPKLMNQSSKKYQKKNPFNFGSKRSAYEINATSPSDLLSVTSPEQSAMFTTSAAANNSISSRRGSVVGNRQQRSLHNFITHPRVILSHVLVICGLILFFMGIRQLWTKSLDDRGEPEPVWKGWVWLTGGTLVLIPGIAYSGMEWLDFLGERPENLYHELISDDEDY